MAKVIIFRRADGRITDVTPCEPPLEGEVEQHYLDRIAMDFISCNPDCAGETRMADVDASTLPSGDYRGAWRHNGTQIAVDMPTARSILAQRLYALRDAKLLAGAVAAFLGGGPERAKLQRLRNMEQTLPSLVANCATVADLISFSVPDLE